MSVTKEDYLRKQEVLKLWGQIVDLFATKSSVTTLQGYFTDGKAKKAIADGDGNTISSTYLKKSGGTMANTNVVTNLNADLLDGQHASSFVLCTKNIPSTATNYDESLTSGIYFDANETMTRPTGAQRYGNLFVGKGGGDTSFQFYFNYSSTRAFLRVGNNNGAIWQSWRELAFLDTTESAINTLTSGLGQLSAMANDNKLSIDAQGDSITELYGYFDGGVAKKATNDSDGNAINTTYFKVSNFTKANIKSTLDISDWALAASKPSYAFSEITGTASDSQIPTLAISKISGLQTALNSKLETSLKGAANGLAELDANGLVPSAQLPSFVDDVLEYASKSAFPATGTSGKIYVALDTNLTYRWSGSAYTEISPSLALGETSSTAYRGDRGKTAYTHATDASRLTTATSSGFYKFATTAEGHIASVNDVTASDITGLLGTTYVTELSWDSTNNKLAWSKGGVAQKAITIGYATSAGKATNDSDGNAINTTYLKLSGGLLDNDAGIGWKRSDSGYTGALLHYNTNNGFAIGYGQRSVGVTAIFGQSLRFHIGDELAATIDSNKNITVEGGLRLRYDADISWMNSSGSTIRSLITYTNNVFALGYGQRSDGETRIYGNSIALLTGTTKRVTITNGGNVGIGTDSPTARLDVSGDIHSSGNMNSEGSIVGMQGVAAYGIADLSIISNT